MQDSAHHYIAIMAGGVGSRFWPASRESLPKQFLDITGDGVSLLQKTVARAKKTVALTNILIVSNVQYKALILEQVPELSEDQILLEPSRNNTAPCVAYTALHLKAKDAKAVFAVVPADQDIQKEDVYVEAMSRAFAKASAERVIVTLGIQPTRPDTGYGYIKFHQESMDARGVYTVDSFKEKPDHDTAQRYLESGDYLWNAGIFVWSTETVLSNFQSSSPQILETLSEDISKYCSTDEQAYIDRVYPQTEKISVDYAILERADNVHTIPVDIGWSDLGTWNSLYSFLEKDSDDNVSLANTHLSNTSGNIIRVKSANKLVVVDGLSDFIVIDEDDVLLIYPRHKEQEIKAIRNQYKDSDFG